MKELQRWGGAMQDVAKSNGGRKSYIHGESFLEVENKGGMKMRSNVRVNIHEAMRRGGWRRSL